MASASFTELLDEVEKKIYMLLEKNRMEMEKAHMHNSGSICLQEKIHMMMEKARMDNSGRMESAILDELDKKLETEVVKGLMELNMLDDQVCSYGVDVSILVTLSQFESLKKGGIKFAIIRASRSIGVVDKNAPENIKNARSAGIQNVDVYIYPRVKGSDPRTTINEAINALDNAGVDYGRVWLDIEENKEENFWYDSKASNVEFIEEMAKTLQERHKKYGIYTSKYMWNLVTGDSLKFSDLPLWYVHYDNKSNFDDFKPFGGWTTPTMKQYAKDVNRCGVVMDLNWCP